MIRLVDGNDFSCLEIHVWQKICRYLLKKREKNGKKKQQIEQPLWRMWAKQFQTGIYVLQYSTIGKKNAKMPGVMAEEIVVLKDGEVLTRTKGMLGISQEELSETKEFFVLLPNDIFDREESSNIL